MLAVERDFVTAFADGVSALHSGLATAARATPPTVLLFGTIGRISASAPPEGTRHHVALAPTVDDLVPGRSPALAEGHAESEAKSVS
jgi:hypothetical protein